MPTTPAGPVENYVVVIEWLLREWGSHSIAEIVEGTELSRGQVRGALGSGVACGWIVQVEGAYRLADRLGLIGDRYRKALFAEQMALQARVERLGDQSLDFLTGGHP